MKKFYAASTGLYTLMLCCIIAGCSTEENPEPLTGTTLEISVVDETGNPVEGAVVDVYPTEESWFSEDPADLISSNETDAEGKLRLKDVEARKYYFSIKYGTGTIQTNWEGVISTEQALEADKVNTFKVVIKESVLGYLAGTNKRWMLESAFMGSEDFTAEMDDCHLDDFMTFSKDLIFVRNQGESKCNSNAAQEDVGSFSVEGNHVTTVDSEGDETIMEVRSINETHFEVSGGDLHPDVRMVYVATYK